MKRDGELTNSTELGHLVHRLATLELDRVLSNRRSESAQTDKVERDLQTLLRSVADTPGDTAEDGVDEVLEPHVTRAQVDTLLQTSIRNLMPQFTTDLALQSQATATAAANETQQSNGQRQSGEKQQAGEQLEDAADFSDLTRLAQDVMDDLLATDKRIALSSLALNDAAWDTFLSGLSKQPQVVGWTLLENDQVVATDQPEDEELVVTCTGMIHDAQKLCAQTGTLHPVRLHIESMQGDVWFLSAENNRWLVLFLEPGASVDAAAADMPRMHLVSSGV